MLIDSSSAIDSGKAEEITVFKKEQEIVLNILNRSYALILKVKWQKIKEQCWYYVLFLFIYLFMNDWYRANSFQVKMLMYLHAVTLKSVP